MSINILLSEITPGLKLSDFPAEWTIQLLKRPDDRTELLERIGEADAFVSFLGQKLDAEFFEAAKKLKIIAQYAVGVNNIDHTIAKQKNIQIANTPDVLTNATAESALALIFALYRRLPKALFYPTQNLWQGWSSHALLGEELSGKTVALIGAGRIGQRLGEILHFGFQCPILYTSRERKKNWEDKVQGTFFSWEEREQLAAASDIVSLHCALTPDTQHLIGHSFLSAMKKGAILINTARGEIIHQEALISYLKGHSGHLYGVGLDVTTPEPLPLSSELLTLPEVVITPHIGSATKQAREKMTQLTLRHLKTFFQV
jgi:glyoxylate reductase